MLLPIKIGKGGGEENYRVWLFFCDASLLVGAAGCRVRTLGMQQGMESEKGEMGVLLGQDRVSVLFSGLNIFRISDDAQR